MSFDLVLRNGRLITSSDSFHADIGITSGKIEEIGQDLSGLEAIDASGLYVLPGAVDPHVHIEMPVGVTISSDDWYSGSLAAAFGGTTTVIDFVEAEPDQDLMDAFFSRRSLAEAKSVLDFAFHMTLSDASERRLNEIPAVMEAGMTSFKTYTTYEGFRLSDADFLKILKVVNQHRGLVIVHAENDSIIKHCTQDLLENGCVEPQYHPLSRPDIAEEKAISKVLSLAELIQAPIYIVHISTAKGVRVLANARIAGRNALGETCPQYLLLTEKEYMRPGFEAAKYICQPPLRKPDDLSALWSGLGKGVIQAIGTDHCPFYFTEKEDLGQERFTDIPGGLPGIESRLALIHSFGVSRGLISLNQWVAACCTKPAEIFGLYPRKGALLPGADADIVLFDPNLEMKLSQGMLHEKVDYTPYEGFKLKGYPVMTLRRGEVLIDHGQVLRSINQGEYLKCGLPQVDL